MKHTRLMFAFAIASLVSSSAIAASVTMLQFGSFETRAEAQKRLNEVTAKHASFLGKLATNIREVKLPPDNLTVYRTQAGPLESRSAAQTVCTQLASAGDECYIVQTAMVSAPEKTTTLADAKPTVAAPVSAAASNVKSEITNAVDAVTPTTPDITSKLSSPSLINARDPLNRAAIANVGSSLGEASVAETSLDANDAQTASVNKALDAAVNEKPVTDANLSSIAEASASPRGGFWARLNPFNDAEPVQSPVVPVPELNAAPIDGVNVADVAPIVPEPLTLPSVSTPEVSVNPPQVKLPKVAIEGPKLVTPAPSVVSLSRTPIMLDSTPVILVAQPLRLPPPPAPLRAQDREELAAGIKPMLARPESIAVGPNTTPATNGSVQVEEAKRVPVTQTLVQPQAQAVPFARAQASVALSPSATDGQKTIWAQVGPFANEQAALAYWTAYRQSHLDFPVVRVRATTPLQASASKSQSWLRVGPVANAAFVTSLCASLNAQTGLRCGAVRDSGASSLLTAPAAKRLTNAQ